MHPGLIPFAETQIEDVAGHLAGKLVAFIAQDAGENRDLGFAVAASGRGRGHWTLSSFARPVDLSEPVWQARYDDFHLFSAQEVEETLIDLHPDPVRAGLAAHPCDGPLELGAVRRAGADRGGPRRLA